MIHPRLVHLLACMNSLAEIGGAMMIEATWPQVQYSTWEAFGTVYSQMEYPEERVLG